MYPELHKFPYFAYDTETTGLQYRRDVVFGFSISTPDGADYYYDIRENPRSIQWFNDAMVHYRGTIICHNASFDYRMSHYTGLYLPLERIDDTVIRAALINEWEKGYSLDYLGEKYLGATKDTEIYEEAARLLGGRATRNVQIGKISQLPSSVVGAYAKQDTRLTLDLWLWQEEEIKSQDIRKIVDFERSVMPIIISTEMAGVNVDLDQAERSKLALTKKIDIMTRNLSRETGFEVNVNSAAHMKQIFKPKEKRGGGWETSDGIPIASTPKGAASLSAESLRGIGEGIAMDILKIRSLIKTRDTFIDKYVIQSNVGSRVYPNINQMKGESGGTYSGRLSYTGVALQQIPSRNPDIARIVKSLFLPDEGCEWGDTDMASFEVRVAAHLMNDNNILSAYRSDPRADFHQIVADILNIPRTASYSGQINAKQTNLSLIFGSGIGTIAEKMGLDWELSSFTDKETGELITYKKAGEEMQLFAAKYDKHVPGVRSFLKLAEQTAKNRSWVYTRMGRHLRFGKGQNYPHKAGGLLIQANAADINKQCWKISKELLAQFGTRLTLNVHDSFSFSCPQDQNWVEVMQYFQKRITEETQDMRAPILLDIKPTGKNWYDSYNKEEIMLDA